MRLPKVEKLTESYSYPGPTLLTFDHTSPSASSSDKGPQAIVYLDLSDGTASSFLNYLQHYARTYPTFQYVVRYKPSASQKGMSDSTSEKRTELAGYGVEMALKKTDYLVVDDRASTSRSNVMFIATC